MTVSSDLKRLGAFLRGSTRDPQSFKVVFGVVVGCVSLMAVEMPLSSRIDAARTQLEIAHARARDAAALDYLLRQIKVLEDRIVPSADLVDWQDYVLTKLKESGAMLQILSPEKPRAILRFHVVPISVSATGSYAQLVDFIDRIERGARIARIEELDLKRNKGELRLDCKIVGLAGKPGLSEGAEAGAAGQEAAE